MKNSKDISISDTKNSLARVTLHLTNFYMKQTDYLKRLVMALFLYLQQRGDGVSISLLYTKKELAPKVVKRSRNW